MERSCKSSINEDLDEKMDNAPVVDGTPAPVVDGTPAPVVDGTPAPVVDGTPAPVVDGTPVQENNTVGNKTERDRSELPEIQLEFFQQYLSDMISVISDALNAGKFDSFNQLKTMLKQSNDTNFTGAAIADWVDKVRDQFKYHSKTEKEQRRYFDPYARRYAGWYTHFKTIVYYTPYLDSEIKQFHDYLVENSKVLSRIDEIPERYRKYLIPPPKHFIKKSKGPSLSDLMKFPQDSKEFELTLNKIFESDNESVLISKKALSEPLPFNKILSVALSHKKKDWIIKAVSYLFAYKPAKDFLTILTSDFLAQLQQDLSLDLSFYAESARMI